MKFLDTFEKEKKTQDFWTFLRLKDKFNPCLNRSCRLRFFIFLKKLGFKKKTELKKKLIYITLQKTQVR